MKLILLLFCLMMASVSFGYDVFVNGYYRHDGIYVAPHHRTSPDNTINNNWSTQGNVNPYTGRAGTIPQNPYQSGYTGGSFQPVQPIQPIQPSYHW